MKHAVKFLLILLLYSCAGLDSKDEGFDMACQEGDKICVVRFNPKEKKYFSQVTDPCLSPDGKRLTYTKSTDSSGQSSRIIIIADLETGDLTPLNIKNNNHYGAIWSPDGACIAFNLFDNNEWCIGVIKTDNTGLQILRSPAANGLFAPSWTPGSQQIIAHDLTTIYVFNLAGEQEETFNINLLIGDKFFVSSATRFKFSADRNNLIFNAGIDETIPGIDEPAEAIFSYDFKSKKCKRLTPRGLSCFDPWPDASDTLYFAAIKDSGFKPTIYKTSLSGLKPIPLMGGSRPSIRVK